MITPVIYKPWEVKIHHPMNPSEVKLLTTFTLFFMIYVKIIHESVIHFAEYKGKWAACLCLYWLHSILLLDNMSGPALAEFFVCHSPTL